MDVILTHENADFDAVASLLGASKLFPTAVPVLPRRINRNAQAFISLYGAELPFVHPDDLPRKRIRRVILVDTQGLTTLRGMDRRTTQVDIIDHHTLKHDLPAGWTFSGEPLGATTTLLVEEIAGRGIRLTVIEATLLLLGIYEDTGSLSYEGTTSRDVYAAGWLMKQGANLAVANKFLHHPLAPEQRRLYECLLEACETHQVAGHTIVIASAEAPDFSEEISILAHKLRDLLEPSALFVLVALNASRRIQLVARSATDDIDVSHVARAFGGGGHARAAAALIRGNSLDAVRKELLDLLPQVVRPSLTVADIMSRGVRVLSPDDTIAEAASQMQRTGHEGYPVVIGDQVLGLLTRRDVDRALQFKMEETPIAQVMKAGTVTVYSDDSIPHLQQMMIESGWGQIPVVDRESGRIIGVVTRTDLIAALGTTPTTPRRREDEIAARLEQALSPSVMALVRHIAQQAHEMGAEPYFVGGVVRDLLLDQPIVDVDMVIEGDAIALARRLSAELGGRVRTHRRFGTAKWLLAPQVWERVAGRSPDPDEDLPASVDFVTARTEFYTHPTALPQVARSSITQDLHRRDFTINTLAIRLNPDHWGELLDYYGGEADLRDGIIRVLHSLSFVDDPTRMLRAARLEVRMGFQLDPRSEELIADALPLLRRVSGERIWHELALIFREAEPERVLCRLETLGILAHIHPQLRCDRWLQKRYRILREELDPEQWHLDPADRTFLYLALMTYRLEREALHELTDRLRLTRSDADDLLLLFDLKAALPQLGKLRRPSAVHHLLEPYPSRVLAAAWVATDRRRPREYLFSYETTWRHVQPMLSGDDLMALGVPPGPIYRNLLNGLRDARLDGRVHTREEEEALLQTLLQETVT